MILKVLLERVRVGPAVTGRSAWAPVLKPKSLRGPAVVYKNGQDFRIVVRSRHEEPS